MSVVVSEAYLEDKEGCYNPVTPENCTNVKQNYIYILIITLTM